jgi:hypothetical protein
MKTIIAAMALVLLAPGPTFAASPTALQIRDGRANAFVLPFSGGYFVAPDYSTTSRETLIRATN